MSGSISVIIADDHRMVRSSLVLYLTGSPDINVVAEAANGTDAVTLSNELQPDIVLMDINMPGLNGINAALQIRHKNPRIKILMLSSFPEEAQVKAAISAGVVGFLSKSISGRELADAIRNAYATSHTP